MITITYDVPEQQPQPPPTPAPGGGFLIKANTLADLLNTLRNPPTTPKMVAESFDVVCGYEKDGVIYLLQADGVRRRIDGNNTWYSGMLHKTFEDRLLAAPPGGIVRYRNKPMRKLTDEELAPLDGKHFNNAGIDFE